MQGTTTELLLMLVLVTLSAFFSATETAYSSLNRARLKSLADRGQKRAAGQRRAQVRQACAGP